VAIDPIREIQSKFSKDGYVVFPKSFSESELDPILAWIERLKALDIRYYSQNTHRWVKPEVNKYGYLENSIQDFTNIYFLQELRSVGLDLLLSETINNALNSIRPSTYVMCQNMLFDKSAETVDHIDSWYLDTYPHSHLIGAWLALEDIHPDCGPFRVYPGSHVYPRPEIYNSIPDSDHHTFISYCNKIKDYFEPKEMLLNSGDLLLWDSRLLHGASRVIDHSLSRKSLTAHFYPIGVPLSSRRLKDHGLNSEYDPLQIKKHLKRQIAQTGIYNQQPIMYRINHRTQLSRRFRLMQQHLSALSRLTLAPIMPMKRSYYD